MAEETQKVAEEVKVEAPVQEAPKAEAPAEKKTSLNASVAPDKFDWDAFEGSAEIYGGENKKAIEDAYDQTLSKIVENEVVEGTVTAISKREVVVNIGYKSEGVIQAPEFRYNQDLKVGDKPEASKHVGKEELAYIEQDKELDNETVTGNGQTRKIGFKDCLKYKQTWAFAVGKFMTDGVWWFFLFWTPSYLNTQFGIKTSDPLGMALIFTLYAITMLSIYGGKLPTIFINKAMKKGQAFDPYAARMKAMLIFAFLPLVVLLAQPLGRISPWFPVILIGIGGAAHQSWSANIFSTVGDMFPKSSIATITGIGGMAGGLGSMLLQKVAGELFVYSEQVNLSFLGFSGKPAGYFIIFCVCATAYLIGWSIMKALVPKYKLITVN